MLEVGVYLKWELKVENMRDLITPCMVASAVEHEHFGRDDTVFGGWALWDTGARMSAISDKVISHCGLIPLKDRGEEIKDVGGGKTYSRVYEISLSMTEVVLRKKLEVITLPSMDYPVIIGMDFIGDCDVSFWNCDGNRFVTLGCPLSSHGRK